MSGIKRKIEDNDPDYEDVTHIQGSKRNKVVEHNNAREATVQKIEAIIREQFSLEMKNKEHEIEVISQHTTKSDPTVLNHPAIRRFLESPSRSSSPLNQGSETPSLPPSESESLSQHGEGADREGEGPSCREGGGSRKERQPGRNTGKDTFGVSASLESLEALEAAEPRVVYHTGGDEASRLFTKKTIVVGNVSKYIPPDKREENDQSTHKWMLYVRGCRREPSIDHFVKKVWFFLHPSYKPNDLVEVSEPPFHLTRRGWGEFPVRIQIHFKDPRNKRIDIIHQLKLDRTYTGLQTLGAETVVDVELHRDSLGDDYLPPLPSSSSSSKLSRRTPSTPSPLPPSPAAHLQDDASEKGFIKTETCRGPGAHHAGGEGLGTAAGTPTRPKASDKVTLGSHGNSAFQPITASCKIAPQAQSPSPAPAESPSKSFQPITMSCKIVSGSPISTPSHSPLPRTPATSTPMHGKQGSSTVLNNPYIIVDKPGHASAAASPSPKQSAGPGARSPAPKVHAAAGGGGGFLSSGMKILVAKGNPSGSKGMAGKQVVAQGIAKAIISGTGGTAGQPVSVKTAGGSGMMATLQLPANNLANLANLPPGTKLYLTTNSKNPSGKGKLLLIPQGAILRATNSAGQQSHGSSSSGTGGSHTSSSSSSSSTSSSLPSNLSYTSYILKQTPQGTFLVGQPAQGSGKQGGSGSSSSSSPATQQAIRVTAGQKAAILAQVVGGAQGSQVKLSDGSVKAAAGAGTGGHLSKLGTTTLRMTGGVITAASSTPSTTTEGAKPTPQHQHHHHHHPVLMAANQAAVINAAKNASAAAASSSSLAKSTAAALVKAAGAGGVKSAAAVAAGATALTVAKSIANMPVVGVPKGAAGMVGGGAKSSGTSLVTAASL
ncbi:hypothetical protein CRUP_024290, partial [Coryphaenoides rupestris]